MKLIEYKPSTPKFDLSTLHQLIDVPMEAVEFPQIVDYVGLMVGTNDRVIGFEKRRDIAQEMRDMANRMAERIYTPFRNKFLPKVELVL